MTPQRPHNMRSQLQVALLECLTAEQAHAVTHGSGPLLIIAGPGAGKTRTLIHRIAWLLSGRLARPWEILAVTFSVRAVGELRLRRGPSWRVSRCRVTAATFHSVCARMLREDAALFGRTGTRRSMTRQACLTSSSGCCRTRARAIQAALLITARRHRPRCCRRFAGRERLSFRRWRTTSLRPPAATSDRMFEMTPEVTPTLRRWKCARSFRRRR